jgi:hypothetical protein
VPPDFLSPHDWLERQPLQTSEQLFAIFSNASTATPFEAWRHSMSTSKVSPIWADTAYAEWEAVMPFVGTLSEDSEFLQWVETTASLDWGWLMVSSASQDALVEHLRSLTQVLLPSGNAVFFRFWDGRYLLPILQSSEVSSVELLPVIGRCLINGQAVEIGGRAQKTSKVFPWWEVTEVLLQQMRTGDSTTRLNNWVQWLSEEQPSVFEAFSEPVLRRKVAHFFEQAEVSAAPHNELVDFLMSELR